MLLLVPLQSPHFVGKKTLPEKTAFILHGDCGPAQRVAFDEQRRSRSRCLNCQKEVGNFYMVLTLPEEVQDHQGNLVQDTAHFREHKGSAFLPNVTETSTKEPVDFLLKMQRKVNF